MKKIKFCVCGLAITIAAVLFAKANLETPIQKEALLISNVEALSESFEWGGTWWNDTDKHSWFSNWKPEKAVCDILVGKYPGLEGIDAADPSGGFPVVVGQGYLVNCTCGDGNCYVGTFQCTTK